jgi:hypothetical protein
MTNLDELKAQWEEHDRLLAKSLRLNRELLTGAKLKSAETALRRLAIYAGLQAAIWLVIVVALGSFVARHFRTPALGISAVAVDVMSIGMLIALIRRMAGSLQIDYSQPISVLQKRVEALRMLRIRTTQWGVLCGTLLWLPWVAVVCQAMFGVDIYRHANSVWLLANGLFGVALLFAVTWVSKKYGDRLDRSPFVQRLMKDLAGNNLNAAQGFLATLREFEQE